MEYGAEVSLQIRPSHSRKAESHGPLRLFFIRIHGPKANEHSISKDVLQRVLHDSRIAGGANDAERIAGNGRGRVTAPEAVRHVIGFRAELELCAFCNTEDSRERQIEGPGFRT